MVRSLIGRATQERHLPLHVSAVRDGQHLVEARAGQPGRVSCEPSCVRSTGLGPVDVGGLAGLVREAGELSAAGASSVAG